MDVGREIRRHREAKGWSQTKLAAAADMAVSGVSQIETGARNPSAVTLDKLATALNVEVGDLFPKAQAPLPLEEAPAGWVKASELPGRSREAASPFSRSPVDPGVLPLDWARNEASEERFERLIAKAPLNNLVRLQWEMIDRFRELRGVRTVSGRLPTYPEEFYLLWFRINTVQRQILQTRYSREEAPIAPEVHREIERLEQTLEVVVQA